MHSPIMKIDLFFLARLFSLSQSPKQNDKNRKVPPCSAPHYGLFSTEPMMKIKRMQTKILTQVWFEEESALLFERHFRCAFKLLQVLTDLCGRLFNKTKCGQRKMKAVFLEIFNFDNIKIKYLLFFKQHDPSNERKFCQDQQSANKKEVLVT